MENRLLEILPPTPVEFSIMLEVGRKQHRKIVKFRPFTLRDEKSWTERFGEVDPIAKAFGEGDFSLVCPIVIDQMDEGDREWMSRTLDIESDELSDYILNAKYKLNFGLTLINILGALRGAAMPGQDAPQSESKKKIISRLTTNWESILCGGLVGALLTSVILLWLR